MVLHGLLSELDGAVQQGVVNLCEQWWVRGLDERQYVVANILPILIETATSKTAKVELSYMVHDADPHNSGLSEI